MLNWLQRRLVDPLSSSGCSAEPCDAAPDDDDEDETAADMLASEVVEVDVDDDDDFAADALSSSPGTFEKASSGRPTRNMRLMALAQRPAGRAPRRGRLLGSRSAAYEHDEQSLMMLHESSASEWSKKDEKAGSSVRAMVG
jgi:hypothetical protein